MTAATISTVLCGTCGGSGQRATARSANGRELERHERAGTPCDVCGGSGRVSEIRGYLEQRLALGRRGRRELEGTHVAIVEAVREALASGLSYDDDVERFVNARAGDLPEHRYHGHPERHELGRQLATEVYIAKCMLSDERAAGRLAELTADGYRPVADVELAEGDRYVVRAGTRYVGRAVAEYGKPLQARVVRFRGLGLKLVPKGGRSRYLLTDDLTLVREGWSL